jgi:hypothetical protein
MDNVTIQLPPRSQETRPQLLHLRPGDAVTFGRGAPDAQVDVPMPHPGVSRLAGEVAATEDHWAISNFSRSSTYVVDNPEGAGEHVKVAPRRLRMPVPFEFARVEIPVHDGAASFLVYASQHGYVDLTEPGTRPGGDPTTAAFAIDETAKYFLILVTLCEPRLRNSATVAIPTVAEVVERLDSQPARRALTRSAVNFHIDYLATAKLRIRERTATTEKPGRLDWKREALVSLALRFDVVREEHLALLPPRRKK